jgi:predicted PurR-regulated permease PerM
LRDWEKLREWLFGLCPENLEDEYRRLHKEIKKVWQAYLRGQLLIMLFIGLFSGIGAAAVGIRSALLLGILAGSLALIPNLGPATATGLAAIVAWVQGSSYLEYSNLTITLIVVLIFGLVQAIEGFWLTPKVMSQRINLHPGVIMVAIVGTLFTLGALIALIVVPILGSLMVIIQYVHRKRAGLDPWPLLDVEDDLNTESNEPEK